MATLGQRAGARLPIGRRMGLVMLGSGALLLALAGGFFGYQAYVDERYEPVVTSTMPLTLPSPSDLPQLAAPPIDPPTGVEPVIVPPLEDTGTAPSAATSLGTAPSLTPSLATLGEVYGVSNTAPQDWDNPLWAKGSGGASEFLPLSELDLPESGLAPATFVRIPIIGLEARTIELGIITTEEGHIQYESPIFDVGIIPGHTTPGEQGNTWLFGHLESPLKGEGAVFRDLPKLHDLIRQEPVYVIVDSADGSFLYQATEFRILPKEDVHFWGSDGRTATLVCSWPRFVYDERVVVTAELVGARLNRELS